MKRAARALALLATFAGAARGQALPEWREWNRPVEPFRIFGPLHYVGASDIAVYAFATPQGLIVLDGGFAETAAQVEANLAKLGFRLADVRILINSHSHFDHAGGLAELRAKSGAMLVASVGDAPQLESGGRGDFAWGDEGAFPPVRVDRRIRDGETIALGGVDLTAHVTAGHTRGCTTWTARLREGEVTRDAVFVCSTSVPDPQRYRLADNAQYPGIAADYERSFATLRALPCDLFLGAHGGFFDLEGKRRRLGGSAGNPFVDPDGYRSYVDASESRFRELLAAARASAPATTSTNSPNNEGRAPSAVSSSDSRP